MADPKSVTISDMADFYKQNGRLPTAADFGVNSVNSEGQPGTQDQFIQQQAPQIPAQVEAEKQNLQTLGLPDMSTSAPLLPGDHLSNYTPKLGNLVADDSPVGAALEKEDKSDVSDADVNDAIKQYGGDASNSRQAVAKVADQEQAARTPEQNAAFDKAKEAALNPAAQDTEFEQAKQEANDRAMLAGVIKAIGQVTQGATTLGAGRETTVDTSAADQMMKAANLPVEQLQQGRQLLAEKLKNASASAKQNANSKESIVARAIAKKIGLPGVDNTTTADAIEGQMKTFEVYQAKEDAAKMRQLTAEQNNLYRQSMMGNKANTQQTAATDKYNQMISGNARGAGILNNLNTRMNGVGQAMALIENHKVNGHFSLNPAEMTELNMELARILTGSGVVHESTMKNIDPTTGPKAFSQLMQQVTGQPVDIANLDQSVTRVQHNLNNQYLQAEKQLRSAGTTLAGKDPSKLQALEEHINNQRSINGISGGEAKAAPAMSKGTITQETLQQYAQKHNIDINQAKDLLTKAGYGIQ